MALILLIEDNADMLQALTEALEINQHQVLPAQTGAEGLFILQEQSPLPDLIITDVRMPQMDGLTFLETVRSTPAWANIPIALMSGQERDMTSAAGVGANAFLPKPFKFQQLEETLETLLA